MSIVYLASNNGTLTEKDNVLFYEDYKGNKTKLLPQKVSQITSQMIDGKKCLIIPMDDDEQAKVNGVNTTL